VIASIQMPGLINWHYDDARIAVQAFLVIGGFLAARTLCPQGLAPRDGLAKGVLRRYLKLAPPFMAAMLIAVLASAWMHHDSISAPPTLPQLAAHALLLHRPALRPHAVGAGGAGGAIGVEGAIAACIAESGKGKAGLPVRKSLCKYPIRLLARNSQAPLQSQRIWGGSSAGRASRSQCEGREFDPPPLHQIQKTVTEPVRLKGLCRIKRQSTHWERLSQRHQDHVRI
jgi:hypothetical protein